MSSTGHWMLVTLDAIDAIVNTFQPPADLQEPEKRPEEDLKKLGQEICRLEGDRCRGGFRHRRPAMVWVRAGVDSHGSSTSKELIGTAMNSLAQIRPPVPTHRGSKKTSCGF